MVPPTKQISLIPSAKPKASPGSARCQAPAVQLPSSAIPEFSSVQLSEEKQILSPCASMPATADSYGNNILARIPAVFLAIMRPRLLLSPTANTSFSFTAAANLSASTMKGTNYGRATSKKNTVTWHCSSDIAPAHFYIKTNSLFSWFVVTSLTANRGVIRLSIHI